MMEHLVPANGNAEDIGVITYIHDLIAERKMRYFPNLKKAIISYDLTISEGNIALNVTSTPVKEKANRNQ